MKKELEPEDGPLPLDETAKLLQELQEAQAERGGSRPSSNLSSLSNTSEREHHGLGMSPSSSPSPLSTPALARSGAKVGCQGCGALSQFCPMVQGAHHASVLGSSQRWPTTRTSSSSLRSLLPPPKADHVDGQYLMSLTCSVLTSTAVCPWAWSVGEQPGVRAHPVCTAVPRAGWVGLGLAMGMVARPRVLCH